MNIRFFKTFCDVVDSGNLSRAALLNGVSQSAVSQQLTRLEKDCGVTLIRRGGATATASSAGRAFYQGAKRIIREYEQMLGNVRSDTDAVSGTLRIAATYSIGCHILNPLADELLQRHPKVDLQIEYIKWNNIAPALLSGEVDLGIVDYPEKRRGIEVMPLEQEKMVMVCSPKHPLASRRSISVMNLQDERFVAFRSQTPTGRYIQQMLRSRKVNVEVVRQFDHIEMLMAAIEADAGLSILPFACIARNVSDGYLSWASFHDGATWMRPIGIIRSKDKPPGKIEEIFLGMIHQGKKQHLDYRRIPV